MFDGLFNMDNAFWRTMGKIADMVILNILFIICCIPIVTIGASYTALYTVTMKLVKNEEAYIFRGFFKAFKDNFKQSTLIWLFMLFFGAFLGVDLYITSKMDMSLMNVLYYIFLVFAVLYAMMLSYVFPILSKFDNTIKNTIKNSLFMGIAHFPWTLLILIINAVPIIVSVINLNYLFSYVLPFMLLIGFTLIAFANSYIFHRVFKKYIPQETEDADSEVVEDKSEGSDSAKGADI